MLRFTPLALILVSSAAIARPPVEVTRFAVRPTIAPGSAVPTVVAPESLEQHSNQDAVGRALSRIGFGPADPANAQYTYTADVTRETRAPTRRRSPITIGIGGGTGGYGGGVGLGGSFGLGGRRTSPAVITRLSVQLRDRITQAVVWEGRATTTDERDQPVATVDRLADALFKDFPGDSGRTIKVR